MTARTVPNWLWRPDVIGASLVVLISTPVAAYGLRQLGTTMIGQWSGLADVTDFLPVYIGARLLLIDPKDIYTPDAVDHVGQSLSGAQTGHFPFLHLPNGALGLAPLALLDYGTAYLVWVAIGVGALLAAVLLLAPGRRVLWLPVLATFLPVQFGLIMGQTAALSLLTFALVVRLVDRQRLSGVVLAISPMAWKPQLLASLVVTLGFGRRWWTTASLLASAAALNGLILFCIGPDVVAAYLAASASNWELIYAHATDQQAGLSLLGVAQALFGPGPLALGMYVVGVALVQLGVAMLWRHGLQTDVRRNLQLAALPIAMVVSAPHVGPYELTLWLASGWLLLRYSRGRPSARNAVVGLCLLGWLAGNVDTIPFGVGFPFASVVGVLALAMMCGLFGSHSRQLESNAAVTDGLADCGRREQATRRMYS